MTSDVKYVYQIFQFAELSCTSVSVLMQSLHEWLKFSCPVIAHIFQLVSMIIYQLQQLNKELTCRFTSVHLPVIYDYPTGFDNGHNPSFFYEIQLYSLFFAANIFIFLHLHLIFTHINNPR
ncbi:hypothetical protein EB796_021102 [Bugula neritina]|uniref:Uncharacterized protein n=1 Tax=Bugula neritina TaxID=10212 RepID=A0A7J7J572_BUGNE|nr:hypothetical protein EB796_021102 [Bugula neritina]